MQNLKIIFTVSIIALLLIETETKKLTPRQTAQVELFTKPKIVYSSEDNDREPFTSKKDTVEYRAKLMTNKLLAKNYLNLKLRRHVSDILDVITVYSLLSEQKITAKPRFLKDSGMGLQSKVLEGEMAKLKKSKQFAGRFARAVDSMYILKDEDFVNSRKLHILDTAKKRSDRLAELQKRMAGTMKKRTKMAKNQTRKLEIDAAGDKNPENEISAELFLEMKEMMRKKSSMGPGPKERFFEYQKKMEKELPKTSQEERMLYLKNGKGTNDPSGSIRVHEMKENLKGVAGKKKSRVRKNKKLKRKKRRRKFEGERHEEHLGMVEKIMKRRRKLREKKKKLAKLARNKRISKHKKMLKKKPKKKKAKKETSRKLKTAEKKSKKKHKKKKDRKTFGVPGMPGGGGGVTQGAGVENLKVVINAIGQPSSYLPVEENDSYKKGYNDADAEPKVIVTRLKLPGRFDSH